MPMPSPSGAHPRSRGENCPLQLPAEQASGSSPLTRGKRGADGALQRLDGLIPAHAGKTRGEGRCLKCRGGSSPLTRGKPRCRISPVSWRRLIPAHAGKTRPRGRRLREGRAHPRSRGENVVAAVLPQVSAGSSPLTRGKPGTKGLSASREGLIPAHAGKTAPHDAGALPAPAHPRSRGENPGCETVRPLTAGSSPLTRGKRPAPGSPSRMRGLIPAHAGKTAPWVYPGNPRRAHPRSRGENMPRARNASPTSGSSPLTRGKQ